MDRAFGWLGGQTLFLRDCHTLNELRQTLQSFISVLFLASVLLRLYNYYAVFSDAFVFKGE
jgi:hypothetical protein